MLLTVSFFSIKYLELVRAERASLALQLGDKHRITTPVNWNKGDDVIVHPSVSNEEAKTLFPEHTVHKVCSNTIATRAVVC